VSLTRAASESSFRPSRRAVNGKVRPRGSAAALRSRGAVSRWRRIPRPQVFKRRGKVAVMLASKKATQEQR
jgi:hypothetical protein